MLGCQAESLRQIDYKPKATNFTDDLHLANDLNELYCAI